MKKKIKSIIILFLFLLVPCFSGCNSIKKPWSYENVVWSSENPQLTIIKDKRTLFINLEIIKLITEAIMYIGRIPL